MAWCPCEHPRHAPLVLPDRDRVDHALHAALEAWLAEDKQELIGLVLGEFGSVHVFEDVGTIHRQQDLLHFEHVLEFESRELAPEDCR